MYLEAGRFSVGIAMANLPVRMDGLGMLVEEENCVLSNYERFIIERCVS